MVCYGIFWSGQLRALVLKSQLKMSSFLEITFFLDKQFPIKLRGDNTCMIDFVWHHCRNKKRFKSYTYNKLKQELSEYGSSFPMMSTQELVDWAKACHPNVSIHAHDATYRKFVKHSTI